LNGEHSTYPFPFAKDLRIPDNVQAYVVDSVGKARESYDKATELTKANMKALEEAAVAAQSNAQRVGEQVLRNIETNTDAAFAAAHALAQAKTLPEFARLQAEFLQKQLSVAGAQSKQLFELSTAHAQQTYGALTSVVAKSFEQLKKVG
jgi:hypothetical protein